MALDASMTDQKTEKMTYIGRRMQKGKLHHCFLDAEGVVTWYPKAKASTFQGARIGTTYEIGGRFPQIWSSVKVGELSDQERLNWQAQDRAAYALKTERAGSSSPDLDNAVDAIKNARIRMNASQRAAFDAWLLNKIR